MLILTQSWQATIIEYNYIMTVMFDGFYESDDTTQ